MRTGLRSRAVRLIAVPLTAVVVAFGSAGCVDTGDDDDDDTEQVEEDDD